MFDVRDESKPFQMFGGRGIQPGQFSLNQGNWGGAYGLCVDEDGVLFATDYNNHRVQMF